MSQHSIPLHAALSVRDDQGCYQLATADQILEAARQVIDRKMARGAAFSAPAAVKQYLQVKLAGFEHEVFAVLLLAPFGILVFFTLIFLNAYLVFFALLAAIPAVGITLSAKTAPELVVALRLTTLTALLYGLGLGWAIAF